MMKVKCERCKKKILYNKRSTTKEITKFMDKGVYLCRPCRRKIILKELKRLLDEKRR